MQDGSHAIFLSTMGQDAENVPEVLVKFLKFVKANLEESPEGLWRSLCGETAARHSEDKSQQRNGAVLYDV